MTLPVRSYTAQSRTIKEENVEGELREILGRSTKISLRESWQTVPLVVLL